MISSSSHTLRFLEEEAEKVKGEGEEKKKKPPQERWPSRPMSDVEQNIRQFAAIRNPTPVHLCTYISIRPLFLTTAGVGIDTRGCHCRD